MKLSTIRNQHNDLMISHAKEGAAVPLWLQYVIREMVNFINQVSLH
jgi:hypothetical protein